MENKEELCNVVVVSKMSPENIEASKETAEKLIEATRKEEGSIRYDWYTDASEAGTGVAIAVFKNQEALQAHANSEHVKEWGPKFKEWVSAPAVARVLKPFDVAPKHELGDEKSQNVVVICKGKEEMSESFKAALKTMNEETRKAKGTLRIDAYLDVKEPGVLVLIECYASKEDCESQLKVDYFHKFMAELKEWQTS